jgi:hypothetical protein
MKRVKHLLFLSILCSLVLFTNCGDGDDPVAVEEKFTLTVLISPTEGGSVSYQPGPFTEGTNVALTATANENYSFKEWTGTFNGTTNPMELIMNANNSVTAVFELLDTDGDGVTDDLDICPETAEGADVNNSGCNTDREFQTNSNSGVYSLLMTPTEYADWISKDEFRDGNWAKGSVRNLIFEDIYKKFPDEYDFIFLVLNEPRIPDGLGYYGMLIGVSNAIEGTGRSIYDYSSDYGSDGKLKSVMQLTGLSYLQNGPSLHELMHNWANFGFETHSVDKPGENITSFKYWGHWGFTGGSTKGQLGGFEQSTLVDLGNTNYSVAPFGPFANGGNSVPFNELELYLMGMAPLSSVSPFDLFSNITAWSATETAYKFTANTRINYDNAAIENLLGKRSPSFDDSQKEFKLLVVVLTDEALTT